MIGLELLERYLNGMPEGEDKESLMQIARILADELMDVEQSKQTGAA